MRRPLYFCALATALAVAPMAPFQPSRPAAPVSCHGTDPVAVVRSYYAAAARHDARAAQACLTGTYRHLATQAVDPDWVNIAAFHLTRVRAYPTSPSAAPGEIRQRPFRLVQVVAEYVVRWRTITSAPNGPGIRFIYIEKERATAPWRIGSIGSGP